MATSIFAFFGSLSLTASQKAALVSLEAFFNDASSQVFILRGYAGTGKTTLVQGVISYLAANGTPTLSMAPTGRAARVLSSKVETDATTVHSAIYQRVNIQIDDEKETYSTRFNVRTEAPNNGTVVLVDEASMLSDSQNSDNFAAVFGSGKLLQDFFSYVNLSKNAQTKVIFIGDDAQLPPVGTDFSPALDTAYLSRYSQNHIKQASLCEVMRYDNGILSAATFVRKSITSRQFNSFIPSLSAEVQTVGSDLQNAYFNRVKSISDTKKSIVLCVSNKSAYKYNVDIRKRFFPQAVNRLSEGDRLMVAANNYRSGQTLMNGEFVEVTAVGRLEVLTAVVKSRCKVNGYSFAHRIDFDKVEVKLSFRTATIQLSSGVCLEVKLFEDFLFSDESTLPSILSQAIFVNLKKRIRERNPNADKVGLNKLIQLAFEEDPYANAVAVKFGYAITGHKAQGGEWQNVFVNTWAWGNQPHTLQHYRWIYTTYTRAVSCLVIESALVRQYQRERFGFVMN